MSPTRKTTIDGKLVEEYYWAGEYVVYVNHFKTMFTYEQVLELLRTNGCWVKEFNPGKLP